MKIVGWGVFLRVFFGIGCVQLVRYGRVLFFDICAIDVFCLLFRLTVPDFVISNAFCIVVVHSFTYWKSKFKIKLSSRLINSLVSPLINNISIASIFVFSVKVL